MGEEIRNLSQNIYPCRFPKTLSTHRKIFIRFFCIRKEKLCCELDYLFPYSCVPRVMWRFPMPPPPHSAISRVPIILTKNYSDFYEEYTNPNTQSETKLYFKIENSNYKKESRSKDFKGPTIKFIFKEPTTSVRPVCETYCIMLDWALRFCPVRETYCIMLDWALRFCPGRETYCIMLDWALRFWSI